MKQYQQLKKEERYYIWNALGTGSTQKQIASTLNRHPSTISREIKRNTKLIQLIQDIYEYLP